MSQARKQTIVDIAVENNAFDTLETALKAAELVEVLSGEGPFTVFAPIDQAFAKLPAGTLQNLLQDKQQLGDILKYHVVKGRIDAAKLSGMQTVTTLQGKELTIQRAPDGSLMVNNARVIQANVEASNGIIHVIDTVLLPPQ